MTIVKSLIDGHVGHEKGFVKSLALISVTFLRNKSETMLPVTTIRVSPESSDFVPVPASREFSSGDFSFTFSSSAQCLTAAPSEPVQSRPRANSYSCAGCGQEKEPGSECSCYLEE